ncbi:MAG TPA: penicillin acylase family protein [Pirellulales bacterium]|jgi:acyl-homoserine lactone acylase PvdQ
MFRHCLAVTVSVLSLSAAVRGADLNAYEPPPEGKVRIVRDTYGVPHIIAARTRDIYFGAGYCQAEDQVEQIGKNYLRAAGRSAEFEGISGLGMDYLVRAFGVPARGDASYEQLPVEHQQQLVGFAAGVNAWLKELRDQAPAWIEPVRPQDVMRFATYSDMQFTLSHCFHDLNRAGVKFNAAEVTAVLADRHATFGSNQFAISPLRSATGAAQLSMDPHLPYTGFHRWYEQHLIGPEFNVMGACFCGLPYISMGRSDASAWCMTVNAPDLGDMFVFDINPDDPNQYRDIDGWRKFDDREELFLIRDGEKKAERRLPVRCTVLGPMVAQQNGKAYVFALPWSEPAESANRARQFGAMARAKSAGEFRDALRSLGLVMGNVVYADAAGDIFYISNGRIPKRDGRISSHDPRPGHESWARWQGFHSLDELPQVLNPPCGYVLNTNSGPQNVCPDVAPRPVDFPSYLMGHEANSRSRRLSALLAADEKITVDEMRAYATDTRVEAADLWLDKLVDRIRDHQAKNAATIAADDATLLKEVVAVLAAWDRRADLDSRGGALFFVICTQPQFLAAMDEPDFNKAADTILKQARLAKQRWGALNAPWSDFCRIRRGDVELGLVGCGQGEERFASFITLRPSFGPVRDERMYSIGGSSYGMVVDFSNGIRAVSCLPFGVSEHPQSKHFADQLPLYAKAGFKPAWFDPDEIRDHTESQRELTTAE